MIYDLQSTIYDPNAMPIRKTTLEPNKYYHVINRGIDNRVIFHDDLDHQTFLDSLVYYLKKLETKPQTALSRTGLAYTGMFADRVKLYSYCLMPTHFHLLFWQADEQAIAKLMQRVGTAYSMYFNRRHKRSGTLFQGRFKTKHIDTDDYLLESTKFIHRDPLSLSPKHLLDYKYSSYGFYVTGNPTHQLDTAISPDRIKAHLNFTKAGTTYQDYIEGSENIDWYQGLKEWME